MEQWHYFCPVSRQSGWTPVLRISLRSQLIRARLKSQHPCEKLSDGSQNSTIASPVSKRWDKRPLAFNHKQTQGTAFPEIQIAPRSSWVCYCCKSAMVNQLTSASYWSSDTFPSAWGAVEVQSTWVVLKEPHQVLLQARPGAVLWVMWPIHHSYQASSRSHADCWNPKGRKNSKQHNLDFFCFCSPRKQSRKVLEFATGKEMRPWLRHILSLGELVHLPIFQSILRTPM